MANGCGYASFRALITSATCSRLISRADKCHRRVTTLPSRRGQTKTAAGAMVDADILRLVREVVHVAG